MNRRRQWLYSVLAGAMLPISAGSAQAQSNDDSDRIKALEARTAAMAEELAALRTQLAQARETGAGSDLQALRTEIVSASAAASRAEKSASEWRDTTTATHISGYAAAGYSAQENGTDSFDVANFNPIFHFQYRDRILWESELEIEVDESGETEVGLEYSVIDVFLNDYLALVTGKFVSPLGNFRQNLHPAWINKLPSSPPGFGHDGAAPIAEVGMQLRGGHTIGRQSRVTYAGYVGNGPKLEAEDGELEGIDTGGFISNQDDEAIVGGRLSVFPIPRLEIGVSGAFGDAAVVENDGMDFDDDPARSYEVLGADFAYQRYGFELRGEYSQQDVGNEATSIAPLGSKWETWYLQSAYKFGNSNWEGVLRYTDFNSAHADETQEQWAVGINYLLAPSAIIKLAYEFNDGADDEDSDRDRWLVQIAYGY